MSISKFVTMSSCWRGTIISTSRTLISINMLILVFIQTFLREKAISTILIAEWSENGLVNESAALSDTSSHNANSLHMVAINVCGL